MQNTKLNFELTIEETNLVLEALGQLPFVRVFGLIGKLQEAARGQVEQGVASAALTATPNGAAGTHGHANAHAAHE